MRDKKTWDIPLDPFFSIIIPVYQAQDTLARCIESVLNQEERNYEIILVDDGSTDESVSICDTYADEYPEIVSVIHKPNEGPLLARMDAIKKSQGQYLLFLDADDTWAPGLLKKLEIAIKKKKADMIIYNYYRKYENGETKLNKPLYKDGQIFEENGKSQLYQEVIAGLQLNALWQKCICRQLLSDMTGLYQYGEMIIGEDKLLSLVFIDNAKKIIYLADGLYNYHIVKNSISHSRSLRHYQDMAVVYRVTLKYMQRWKLNRYRIFCCMEKTEFGISSLYSLVNEIQKRKKSFSDFEELASYIISDKEFWGAFLFCRKKLSFRKKLICILLQRKQKKAVFLFIYLGVLIRVIQE